MLVCDTVAKRSSVHTVVTVSVAVTVTVNGLQAVGALVTTALLVEAPIEVAVLVL